MVGEEASQTRQTQMYCEGLLKMPGRFFCLKELQFPPPGELQPRPGPRHLSGEGFWHIPPVGGQLEDPEHVDVSRLAWERMGIPLEEVTEEREDWAFLLRLLLLQPDPR